MVVKQRLSVEQYLALPEEKPYLEYVFGEVVQKALPNSDHVRVVASAGYEVHTFQLRHTGSNDGPEPRVRFDTERGQEFRLPDYAYWAPSKPYLDGDEMLPPTLAIEVQSPDETMADQREKCRYYGRYGVDIAWLFDPRRRTVEVFDKDLDGQSVEVLSSPMLPGISIDVAAFYGQAIPD